MGDDVGPGVARSHEGAPRIGAAAAAESPGPGAVSRWHLFDVGFTRDCWMHRTDLAMATGRAFDADPEHDGRILADIVAVHLRARRTDDYDRRLTRGLADAG